EIAEGIAEPHDSALLVQNEDPSVDPRQSLEDAPNRYGGNRVDYGDVLSRHRRWNSPGSRLVCLAYGWNQCSLLLHPVRLRGRVKDPAPRPPAARSYFA